MALEGTAGRGQQQPGRSVHGGGERRRDQRPRPTSATTATPAALGNFVWERPERRRHPGLAGEPGIGGRGGHADDHLAGQRRHDDVVKTTTDANGSYSFGNLLLDENIDGVGSGEPTFSIAVATPTGYVPTLINARAARRPTTRTTRRGRRRP